MPAHGGAAERRAHGPLRHLPADAAQPRAVEQVADAALADDESTSPLGRSAGDIEPRSRSLALSVAPVEWGEDPGPVQPGRRAP